MEGTEEVSGTPSVPGVVRDLQFGISFREDAIQKFRAEIAYLRDRAVCSGCGGDVAESGVCIDECGEGEMIPASDLPRALRNMRAERDELQQELNDV